MALKATIFKAALQVADMGRNYYQDHALTIARHPSETDERMMVRLLAFALHAHERLAFGTGLSSEDEPDLWQKDLTGAIESWIDVGQPDDKRLKKASGRASQVFVYNYGGHGSGMWFDQIAGKIERMNNLTVMRLPPVASQALAKLACRNMQLNCTVQEGQIWFADENETVEMELTALKMPTERMR